MVNASDAYFKTEKGIEAQKSVETMMLRYHEDLLDFLGIYLEDIHNQKYLDVGCARGLLLKSFHQKKFEVFGCDISKYAVDEATKLVPSAKVTLSDASESIPFNEKFGIITSFGVLGLIDRKKRISFLNNCFEALDKGGIFIATAPNKNYYFSSLRLSSFRNSLTASEWSEILKKFKWKNLEILTIQRIPIPFHLIRRCYFIKTRFGNPIVFYGVKEGI